MKKKVIIQSLLILFPVLAVGLATTGDSVTVFDTVSKQTQFYSYFDVLPVENLQMIPVMAALLAAASGIAAAVYMAKKKPGALKTVGYLALASACMAGIPPILRGQILVIPNMALPIFMILEYFVSAYVGKLQKENRETVKNPNRLPGRRK